MIELACSVIEREVDLETLAELPDAQAIAHLQELRGVGRWTAEYVLLRGLGRVHIFPGDDVGARNNLQRWLHRARPLDYERVRRIVTRWDGFGGLVYFHLLLDRLMEAGYLSDGWSSTVGGAVQTATAAFSGRPLAEPGATMTRQQNTK